MTQYIHALTTQIHETLAGWATPEFAAAQAQQGLLFEALCYVPSYLQAAFGTVAPDGHRHQRPALELQSNAQLKDIGCNYTLPQGLNAATLEAYCRAMMWGLESGRLSPQGALVLQQEALMCIENFNPPLRQLRFERNHPRECHDVLLGISSGLKVADIQFYLEGNRLVSALRKPHYRTAFEKACEILKIKNLGWTPAPETLASIVAQAQSKPCRN